MFSIPSGTWPKKVHLQSCKYYTVNNTLPARSDSSMFYTWLTPSVLHGLFSIPYFFSCTKWWPPTLLSFNQTISLPLSPPPAHLPVSCPPPPPPLLYFMTGPLQKITSTPLRTWWGWPDFSHFRLLWLQQSRKSKLASPSAWRLSINLKFNYRAIFEKTLRRKEQSFLLEHELLLTLAKPKFSIPVC